MGKKYFFFYGNAHHRATIGESSVAITEEFRLYPQHNVTLRQSQNSKGLCVI